MLLIMPIAACTASAAESRGKPLPTRAAHGSVGASMPPAHLIPAPQLGTTAQPILVEVKNTPTKADFLKDYGPTILGFGGTFVGILTLILAYWYNDRLLRQKQHEEERNDIYAKLNGFYGPFRQLLGVSKDLFDQFTYSKPAGFRTLIALIEGETFRGNDKALLEQILVVTGSIDKLILEKSGLVNDLELHSLLSKASTHFQLMRLAYEGRLHGEPDRFERYIFPRELAGKIDTHINGLQDRLKQLDRM
jgi:hypothetical protein